MFSIPKYLTHDQEAHNFENNPRTQPRKRCSLEPKSTHTQEGLSSLGSWSFKHVSDGLIETCCTEPGLQCVQGLGNEGKVWEIVSFRMVLVKVRRRAGVVVAPEFE